VRALVVTQNITVDGSIEMLGDWFDPEGQGDQSDLLEELHRQDSQSNAFLTGRQTFEDLRSYWPKQLDDASGITKYLTRSESTWCPRPSQIRSGRTPPSSWEIPSSKYRS
jgi:hypothetical protein